MSGNSSGERVAFDIGGFVLKITETGTEPRFFTTRGPKPEPRWNFWNCTALMPVVLLWYAKGRDSPTTWNDKGKIDVSSEGPSSGVSELVTNSRQKAFARNVDFSFIVSGSEKTFTFRVSLNTLPTLGTLVRGVTLSLYLHWQAEKYAWPRR